MTDRFDDVLSRVIERLEGAACLLDLVAKTERGRVAELATVTAQQLREIIAEATGSDEVSNG